MSAYEVIIKQGFSSAHALRHYHGSEEPLHGHNFEVEVILSGNALENKVKYLVDFIEAQRALEAVVKPLDHVNLNDTPPFDQDNPSAENLARFIAEQLQKRLNFPGVRLTSVTVWETPMQAARYLP